MFNTDKRNKEYSPIVVKVKDQCNYLISTFCARYKKYLFPQINSILIENENDVLPYQVNKTQTSYVIIRVETIKSCLTTRWHSNCQKTSKDTRCLCNSTHLCSSTISDCCHSYQLATDWVNNVLTFSPFLKPSKLSNR